MYFFSSTKAFFCDKVVYSVKHDTYVVIYGNMFRF